MSRATITALRVIIALCLAGSLGVQTVIVPLLWIDLAGAPTGSRIAIVVLVVLWILCLQVAAVCVWRLLTLVRDDAVFQASAFGYVDVITGAATTASVLTFAFAGVLAPSRIAPGIVGIICGVALAIAGVALLVVVMRALLAQATAARTELDEVI